MDRLKVFISSTQSDLKLERNKVEEVIDELGHECLRAESYISPGLSPHDVCLEMAKDCDVYIGIYGKRYGFVPKEPNISVTEMEYRSARQKDPSKILIYIKNEEEYDEQQRKFLEDVQDFCHGYFRHEKFKNAEDLKMQLRIDLIAWMSKKIHQAILKDLEISALKDKIQHMRRIMEMYSVPEDLI